MDPSPPIRKHSRDLHLSVTELAPLPIALPTWERRLIEQSLVESLDAKTSKEAHDAHAP
jgi:hypothetical protein